MIPPGTRNNNQNPCRYCDCPSDETDAPELKYILKWHKNEEKVIYALIKRFSITLSQC